MNTYVTGTTVKQPREARKLTQSELAEQIGVSSKTVSKWETAKGLPDISLLQPLAQALGISLIELMNGEQIENKNISANMLRSKFYVCPICGNAIHALGNEEISTPNMDWLVHQGTSFTRAHIPGGTASAVCMPSRAMINSGKTLFHLEESGRNIPTDHVTMGQCFLQNGYHAMEIGKWHNGVESFFRSFDDGANIFFGGMWDHWNVPVNDFKEDGKYDKQIHFTPNFSASSSAVPMPKHRSPFQTA